MAYPTAYRFNQPILECHTASCGSSPIPGYIRIPFRCEIVSFDAITATSLSVADCIVTVALNGTTVTSTDSTAYMNLTVASAGPGCNTTGKPVSRTYASPGDYLAFTPASATGTNVPATFRAILRAM